MIHYITAVARIFSFIIILILLVSLQSCRLTKLGRFYLSENHQKPAFPYNQVSNNQSTVFTFHQNPTTQKKIEAMEFSARVKKGKFERVSLGKYLDEQTKTTAFLVLRNDTILYEQYFEGFDRESLLPSFSIAKSFVSSLVGIAIQEGYIKSIEDPITDYLGELKALHPYWSQLKIKHLLNMQSGITFDEENYTNPFSDIADLYMAKDIWKIVKRSEFGSKPGETHYYSSLDTEILGLVLERAVNKPLSSFLEEKIWQPLGMESNATWNVDHKDRRNPKAYCCLNVIARDYAKFGRLYLNDGNWNGKQIVSEHWVNSSTHPNFSNNCYQYQWYSGQKSFLLDSLDQSKWKLRKFPDSLSATKEITRPTFQHVMKYKKDGSWIVKKCGPAFFALGVFGQEIYINPDHDLIFVRLGKKWDMNNETAFTKITEMLAAGI